MSRVNSVRENPARSMGFTNWAKLSMTPTADVNPNADLAPGIELKGARKR